MLDESTLHLEWMDIDAVQFALNNPKNHDLQSITESIQRYSFTSPPILNEQNGRLVAGQGRIESLRAMKKANQTAPKNVKIEDGKWLIPVVRGVEFKDENEAAAYLIDDNSISLLGGEFTAFDLEKLWDPTEYEKILSELRDADALSVSVESSDLDALLAASASPLEEGDVGEMVDRAAELQEKWKVERRQIWEIPSKRIAGKAHRVMCGDSTSAEDVAKLMRGERARIFLTDPPYGVGYEYESHDDSDQDAYFKLCKNFMAVNLKLDCFGIVLVGHKHNSWWVREFHPDSFLVWFDKTKQSPHKIAHLCKSELILTFGKPSGKYAWDTFEIQGVRGDGLRELHSCPKPVGLFQKLIEPQVEIGGIIYDSFLGSGTTLIACEQTGRVGYGMEIEPKYVAVTLERLSVVGLEPVLCKP